MATLQMNILSMKLGMQTNFSAILPSYVPCRKDADKTLEEIYPLGKRFRTLWLLPTEYGDDSELLHNTQIQQFADEHELAVVLPAPLNRLYANDPSGMKYMDLVTEELWHVCHGAFALSYERSDNYIGGVGLGAYGALKGALRNPEKYSKVIMIGGAFETGIKDGYFKALNEKIQSEGLIPHYGLDDANEDDAELILPEGKNPPEVYIYWAQEGPMADFAARGAENLKAAGILAEAKAFPGPDNWIFRNNALLQAAEACIK